MKTANELITVIVPVYGAERFLPRCIDSLLRQTYTRLDILLIDDGSPDRCGAICDEYAKKDGRIRAIHQQNRGVSETRNRGLQEAQGSLIYFLDSDDYIPDHALKRLYDIMQEKDADIVIGGHSRVEPDGYIHCDSDGWPETDDGDEIKDMILRNRLPNFVCAKLFRRRVWDGIVFPKGQVMEDMYVAADVFYQARRVAMTKESLYFYSRENPSSIMSDSGTKYIRLKYGQFLAWREHERIAEKMGADCREYCRKKALHAAVRAVMLDAGANELNEFEVAIAEHYISETQNINGVSLRLARWLVLQKCKNFLALIGYLQRKLVNWQQFKRSRKSFHR